LAVCILATAGAFVSEDIAVYPSVVSSGLTLYFVIFGIAGVIFGVIMLLGLSGLNAGGFRIPSPNGSSRWRFLMAIIGSAFIIVSVGAAYVTQTAASWTSVSEEEVAILAVFGLLLLGAGLRRR